MNLTGPSLAGQKPHTHLPGYPSIVFKILKLHPFCFAGSNHCIASLLHEQFQSHQVKSQPALAFSFRGLSVQLPGMRCQHPGGESMLTAGTIVPCFPLSFLQRETPSAVLLALFYLMLSSVVFTSASGGFCLTFALLKN